MTVIGFALKRAADTWPLFYFDREAMSKKSTDLHGNAPDHSNVALLLLDVINDLEFEGGDLLAEHALPAAKKIASLKSRARLAGIPTIYVNDNFGKWRSDFKQVLAHVIEDETRGRPIAELLRPDAEDYFVLKPKHSGFFFTSLDLLLRHLGSEILILVGWAGDMCILFTASDAHMRDYDLVIPGDCVASQDAEENERVLKFMQKVQEADIRPSIELDLKQLQRQSAKHASEARA
jgi:nicotinamidase-related amidase